MNNGSVENIADGTPAEPGYQFRARLFGAPNQYRLTPDTLTWTVGNRSGELFYRDVAAMRIGFRPTNFMSRRFITEIRGRDGLKLIVSSLSMKSMFDSENQGPAYRSFICDLAARIQKVTPDFHFDAGLPRWRWWPAAAFMALTLAALSYILVRSLFRGEYSLMLVLVLFAVLFIWQVGGMLRRNWPRRCKIGDLPQDIIP